MVQYHHWNYSKPFETTHKGTNISYLGKRKIIDSKVPLIGDMLVPRMVYVYNPSMKKVLYLILSTVIHVVFSMFMDFYRCEAFKKKKAFVSAHRKAARGVFAVDSSTAPPPRFQSSRAFRNWALLQEQPGYLHDCYDCCCDHLLLQFLVVVDGKHHHHLRSPHQGFTVQRFPTLYLPSLKLTVRPWK